MNGKNQLVPEQQRCRRGHEHLRILIGENLNDWTISKLPGAVNLSVSCQKLLRPNGICTLPDLQTEQFCVLWRICESQDFMGVNVYICGPVPFMQEATRQLAAAGVPRERIAFEAFTPLGV